MDSSNSDLNALKGTANLSHPRPPTFPAPSNSSDVSSLPESPVPNIPPDLVTEILSRIPIRSLLRFRCVCKAWRDTISDPLFSLSFQDRKLAMRFCDCLYVNTHSESEEVSWVPLCNPMRKKDIGGAEELKMTEGEILGSCKGFLLAKLDFDLYLWNPSIRQCTKVLSLPRPDYRTAYERVLSGSGLCYDSSNDDYKAVLAYDGYYDIDCDGDYVHMKYERLTAVASLKSRRWTSFCLPYKLNSGAVVINERLHWVVRKRYENGMQFPTQQIVCFDPLVDEFAEFSTQLPYNEDSNVILDLGVLDGCLCLTCHCCDESGYDNKPDIEVLVMKEYGVEESWFCLFVISRFGGLSEHYDFGSFTDGCWVPLCLTKNGEQVIIVNGEKILFYNPLEDWCECYIANVRNVFTYEESLVPPDLYGGGYDWRIGRMDAWNVDHDYHRDRGRRCQCCDYVPSWNDINDFLEEDCDRTYDWEEDFLEKGKERLRMRIKTKYYRK